MPIILRNRKLTPEECVAVRQECARASARLALTDWYAIGFRNAENRLRKVQIDENLELLKDHPNWRATKDPMDGYVMLKSLVSEPKPVCLRLDFQQARTGGLTYRELHKQLRSHLGLEPKESLRLCPYRP